MDARGSNQDRGEENEETPKIYLTLTVVFFFIIFLCVDPDQNNLLNNGANN